MNIKNLLERLRYIGYLIIVFVDCGITFLSMMSLGHNQLAGAGLGALGVVIVLLATWVFLKGIRLRGSEKAIYLGAWIICCVLIVSLNWGFTRQNLSSQSDNVQTLQEDAAFERESRQREINSTQNQIDALVDKLDKVNVWREADRKSINDDLKEAKDKLSELKQPINKSIDIGVSGLSVFDKMAEPFGLKGKDVSNWWWLIAFVALQLLAVLAAPKSDDKRPRRKHAPRITRDVSMRRLVEWWVSTNWMGIRTGKSRTILPRESFDKFTSERWQPFPGDRYDAILQAANRTQVIDGAEIREADEAAAIKRILGNVGKQKTDQPELF
jgi:hypothetical protein